MPIFIDEPPTHMDVHAEGFIFRVYTQGSEGYLARAIDPTDGATIWANFGSRVRNGGAFYSFSSDEQIMVRLVDPSPNCVVIHCAANFESDTQVQLTGESGSEIWYWIYSDTVYQKLIFNNSASITMDNSISNRTAYVDFNGTNTNNETTVYESSGSEATASADGSHNSSTYTAGLTDELNVMSIMLQDDHAGTATIEHIADLIPPELRIGWNNGTITAGSHVLAVAWVIDTADRPGGMQTNSTNRPLIAAEIVDATLENLTLGSNVAGLNIPDTMSSGPKAVDGARHYTLNPSHQLSIASAAENYSAPVRVAMEAPYLFNGAYNLLEFFVFADNAVSATLTATEGDNGTWRNVSDGLSRNTSADSVTGWRGAALDFGAAAYGDLATTHYTNAFFQAGAAFISVLPQFSYNTTSNQVVFCLYVDATNFVVLQYNAAVDQFELHVSWGGTSTYARSAAFTDDASLQQWQNMIASWGDDTDATMLSLNGAVSVEVNTGTPSGSAPTSITLGAKNDRSLPGDYHINYYAASGGLYLPYGGRHTDEDQAFAQPDSRLTLIWDAAGTSMDLGSGTITYTGNFISNGGPGGLPCFSNTDSTHYCAIPTSGNINASEGEIDFWFKINTAPTADGYFLYAGSGLNLAWDDSDNDIVGTYAGATVRTVSALPEGLPGVYHVLFGYKASSRIYLAVNGVFDHVDTGVGASPTLDANMILTAQNTSGTNGLRIRIT